MRQKNGSLNVPDIMIPSDEDLTSLAFEVEKRFLDLCGAFLRIRGHKLVIPPNMKTAALKWREMVLRHRGGDLRNSLSEKRATREMAEWTHRINCEIRNQTYTPIVWKD